MFKIEKAKDIFLLLITLQNKYEKPILMCR